MTTVKELKAQAKARGIKGFSTMRKADLEKALSQPPPKPPRTKSKAEQAKNPVKKVTKVQAPAKKAPAPASKESADMKFIKRMKNTVADGKRLNKIFKKYGKPPDSLKPWKNIRVSKKVEKGESIADGIDFQYGHSGITLKLENIAKRVREGKSLADLPLSQNFWMNALAGIENTDSDKPPFSFEKLLKEAPAPKKAPAKKAPAKKAPPKPKKAKLLSKKALLNEIIDDDNNDMSSEEYNDNVMDYMNDYPKAADTEKQMEKLLDYAGKQIINQIYEHYKENAGNLKKFSVKNFYPGKAF